jgi:hypothetical protein
MVELPPIDNFFGALTKNELVKAYEDHDHFGNFFTSFYHDIHQGNEIVTHEKCLKTLEDFSKLAVFEISKDDEIRGDVLFFAIPVCHGQGMFDLCSIVKLNNNGSTFVLTNEFEFAKFLLKSHKITDKKIHDFLS